MWKTLIVCLIGWSVLSPAQSLERQVVAAGGGSDGVTSINLSWTAGEPVAGYLPEGSISLGQGFQQGELLLNPTDVDRVFAGMRVRVFPNPTAAVLNLEAEEPQLADSWQVVIFSAAGRRVPEGVRSWPAGEQLLALDVGALPPGQYYLHIYNRLRSRVAALPFQKIGDH